jgi:polyferredoxin
LPSSSFSSVSSFFFLLLQVLLFITVFFVPYSAFSPLSCSSVSPQSSAFSSSNSLSRRRVSDSSITYLPRPHSHFYPSHPPVFL